MGTRAEAGGMQPQARECRQPPKLGEAGGRLPPEPREGTQSCQHDDFSSLPPESCPPGKGKGMRESRLPWRLRG